jgi:hypothetical protein
MPKDVSLCHAFAEIQVKLQMIRRHRVPTGKRMHRRRLPSIGPNKHRLKRLPSEKWKLRGERQAGMGFLNLAEQGFALKRAHD